MKDNLLRAQRGGQRTALPAARPGEGAEIGVTAGRVDVDERPVQGVHPAALFVPVPAGVGAVQLRAQMGREGQLKHLIGKSLPLRKLLPIGPRGVLWLYPKHQKSRPPFASTS